MRASFVKRLLVLAVFATICMIPQSAWAGDLVAGTSAGGASISYRAHVAGGSWAGWKSADAQVGSGQDANKIDALSLKVNGSLSGGVQYQVYIKKKGWQSVRSNGAAAGKVSPKYNVEAVRIALTGEVSKYYDVSYSVKRQGVAWSSYARNGAVAGAAGKGRAITAVKVKLEAKESAASDSASGVVGVRYRAKTQSGKWQAWKAVNAKSNTAKKNKSIRSLKIALDRGVYSGDIKYRVRLSNGKWKSWKKNGASIGSYKKVEAVRIKLTGAIAQKYDVVYRTNVKGVGWQKRTMNGGVAGTRGKGRYVRSIKIALVEKSKRSGWYGSGTNWMWYSNGTAVKNKLITTAESPIDALSKKSRKYWIDGNGKLAVNRLVNPDNAIDSGAGNLMLASEDGYILTSRTLWIDSLGAWFKADSNGVLRVSTNGAAGQIESYVQWAIDIANSSKHGYSQLKRWGPDYDCSSLVVSALKASGFQVGGATYTGNMKSELTKHGFKWHSGTRNLQRGDILLVHNSSRQHTEIYIGNGLTVGAHIDENGGITGKKSGDQTGNEISVASYSNIWQGYLRFEG